MIASSVLYGGLGVRVDLGMKLSGGYHFAE
jgi:hypothetical protein